MQQENVQGAIPEQYRIADARMQLEKCTGRNPGTVQDCGYPDATGKCTGCNPGETA